MEDSPNTSRLHPLVLKLVADKLGVDAALIEDLELQLIDIQPSTLGTLWLAKFACFLFLFIFS